MILSKEEMIVGSSRVLLGEVDKKPDRRGATMTPSQPTMFVKPIVQTSVLTNASLLRKSFYQELRQR